MGKEPVGVDTRYYINGPVAWRAGVHGQYAWVEALGSEFGVLTIHCDPPGLLALRDELLRVLPLEAPAVDLPHIVEPTTAAQ